MKRRTFIKWSASLGSTAVSSTTFAELESLAKLLATESSAGREVTIRVGCPAHNCGGRCLLVATVKDGVLHRLEPDDREPDTIADPQLRPCARGLAYRRRQYHPDRLKFPMRRVGERGEGKFERISWDTALDWLASELRRVKAKYGPSALYVPFGSLSSNQLSGRQTAKRLLNLMGGSLNFYNSYSWGCLNVATPTVYGTNITGNQRQDWVNSKFILMWGWNPAEIRDGTNSEYFIKKAREAGARVVCIDPRMSASAVALADEWIPIRPGTDTAMMTAMAYVMIEEDLIDLNFIDRCCVGFDRSHMPEGVEEEESYRDYVLGRRDGVPKSPVWAETITTVPRETIARIARQYATIKPGMLYQGYGMQRRAYGEQVVRAGCVLAAITGNVGISGGWAGGTGLQADDGGALYCVFPTGKNPVKASIPVFLWTEAVLHGKGMGPEHGVQGVEKLDNSIRLLWAVATNALINQHANINRTAKILQDERLVEFIAVQDQFMTASGRFADLLLPVCTQFEMWGLEDGWKYGEELILMPPLFDPSYESRSDYQIGRGIAQRLGLEQAYTEGRDEKGWIAWALERYRDLRFPNAPSLEQMAKDNKGVYSIPVTHPKIAFADFRKDPEKHPLPTPSGKIEIFSTRLHELAAPREIPPIPKYIQEWESPFGPEAERYPLQAVGHHTMGRVHSIHDNVDWLREAFPQRIFINPIDAEARNLRNGDQARVFNDRGTIIIPCRITPRIMPGVVDVPQGAWWQPDEKGIDLGGSINTLTSERWTPHAFATAQHTIMVQVEKA